MIIIVLNQSRKITIPVKQKTAEVFNAVLNFPRNFLFKTEKVDSQWNSVLTSHDKDDFNSKNIELNPSPEEKIPWNLPLKIISIGADSKVVLDLPKSEKMTEQQYKDGVREIKNSMINLIRTIELE
jgi:hypothetical protein